MSGVLKARRVRAAAGVLGAAVALAVGAPSAYAGAPPAQEIFPRVQSWECGDLGGFVTIYNTPGATPAVLWLSRDGGRTNAVQVTVISLAVTMTFPPEEDADPQVSVAYTYVSREPAPRRVGQAHYTCRVHGSNAEGTETINGSAVVGVVGTGSA